MKILFLCLIALHLMSCGKNNKPQDNWIAPHLYFLNSSNKVLTNDEMMGLNDYVYFSNESESPSEIKKSTTPYSVSTDVTCIARGKKFVSNKIFQRDYIQLKEFLPIQALLNTPSVSCKMKFVLKNSYDSTKNYFIPEKKIEIESFKGDFSLPKDLSEELSLTGPLSLVCEEFMVHSEDSKNTSIQELIESFNKQKGDIDIKQYKPHTNCRVQDGFQLSKILEIQFEKLIPKYSFKIYREWTQKRAGDKLYLYDLYLSNPHNFPISFALNKSSLKVPLSIDRTTRNDGSVSSPTTGLATVTNSNPDAMIDKGNVYVVHLEPKEEIAFQAINQSECKNGCVYSEVRQNNLPIYNLEYNYRTREEILRASDVKILDLVPAN